MSHNEPHDGYNLRTPGHIAPHEAIRAGAHSLDTSDDIHAKVMLQRSVDQLNLSGHAPGSWKTVANLFAMLSLGSIAVIALAFATPWLQQVLKSPSATWERFQVSRSVDERREKFSDFSSLADWPKGVQNTVARRAQLSATELAAQIPKTGLRSDRLREEFGASMWFAMSASGKNAHTDFDVMMKMKGPQTAFMSANFLANQCKAGLEVACLDLAKAITSAVFRPEYTHGDTRLAIRSARAKLPDTGPLARSPAVIDLKKRLAEYDQS